MTTFTAVVTSHANERGLRHILGQLRYQTRPPDETLVFYSGEGYDPMRLAEHFPEAEFHERPNLEDWGHEKRAEGVENASSFWVGFFNDDDRYEPRYIELMLKAAQGTQSGAVYCGWTGKDGNPSPGFVYGQSTSGNFIVRTKIARKAGYTNRDYAADGWFINRVSELTHAARVPEVLYHHNAQEG